MKGRRRLEDVLQAALTCRGNGWGERAELCHLLPSLCSVSRVGVGTDSSALALGKGQKVVDQGTCAACAEMSAAGWALDWPVFLCSYWLPELFFSLLPFFSAAFLFLPWC